MKRIVSKKALKNGISTFQKEFRKHLATFITGAFSFVAALLWRDTIQSFLEKYQTAIQESLPIKDLWLTQFLTAFGVTVVAVVVIIIISRVLKPE